MTEIDTIYVHRENLTVLQRQLEVTKKEIDTVCSN
jgi:hypothetical protein